MRKGSTLSFQVSDGSANLFREISRTDFGVEETDGVRFIVTTNVAPVAVDARLVDLRVRCGSLADGQAALSFPWRGEARSKRWLLVAAFVLLVLLLSFLGAWLSQRRRAAKASAPTRPPDRQATPAPAAPALACSCAACGITLKAKPALAGKKVKCPRCGLPVPVPERGT